MALPRQTVNPYLAMRAVLRTASAIPEVSSVAVPGLGTGVGRVTPAPVPGNCERLPQTWAEATEDHQLLPTDDPTRLQY